ncbi:hypothetical protein DdX_18252 [Ditylenchus destructor]|uniref:Uncharacterized protein n=1 Tax=Ditylenchus destructor TaxID=166010 RepID=A0AAD4QYG3_9BILA|nr:hypothetical protein DdX_18252 [Ditylenchus destructor]
MNSICRALCFVIVISFAVSPVVAPWVCPHGYDQLPLRPVCNPFEPDTCAQHAGTQCVALMSIAPHVPDPDADAYFTEPHGCCKPGKPVLPKPTDKDKRPHGEVSSDESSSTNAPKKKKTGKKVLRSKQSKVAK